MDERERHKKSGFWKGFCCGAALLLVLLSVCGAVVGLLGIFRGDGTAYGTVQSLETREKLKGLAAILDRYYYGEVDSETLAEGLYAGLLDSLGDPYSRYYTAEEYQELQESTSGSYCGIGAVMSQDAETMEITLLHVYENAPAAEAGLQDGDILIAVDGSEVGSEELSELVKRIKGEEGTSVGITVQRQGEEQPLEFVVERRQIQVPTVDYVLLEGKTGFVQISEFSEPTAEQFQTAVQELTDQGMTALIVDLRDNPGGLLSSVCEVLDQLLPEGLLVYTEDKEGNREEYRASGKTGLELPVAVLINGNSASASEIFAGAVKDYGYGTLIGTKTFGKGIVQQIFSLGDGSGVKVTIAKYFTPKGNDIHGVGIAPDVELEYEYQGPEGGEYDPMQDNQVLKALEVLETP